MAKSVTSATDTLEQMALYSGLHFSYQICRRPCSLLLLRHIFISLEGNLAAVSAAEPGGIQGCWIKNTAIAEAILTPGGSDSVL
jgi:hypothetical protein